jgi:hypothetical protein
VLVIGGDMISIVINCDTRSGAEVCDTRQGAMLNGTRSFDFLTEGILNKIKFFRGYDYEVVVYIDKHLNVPGEVYNLLNVIPNITFCQSNHREYLEGSFFPKWNDLNFLQALYLARGDYIAHFDGDVCAFRDDNSLIINNMIRWLDHFEYVSYPSHWTPAPDCNANNEWDYWWASTRFFICKRSSLDFKEIEKCLRESDYLYGKYGDKKRKCPWLEHILGIIAGPNKVYYPPIKLDEYAIFSWSSYKKGTLQLLNNMSYNEVKNFIIKQGGIHYPNDVSC